jgi:hypothetical protein
MWLKNPIAKHTSILLCMFGVCLSGPAQQTQRTPTTFLMARQVKRIQPGWRFVGGWCTCPPLVPGQIWRDNATWERKDRRGQREFVSVEIVKASSTEETAKWMRQFGTKGSSCSTETISLGDEGYLLTCPRSFKSQLRYRKGQYLVNVDGDSRVLVERFANYTLKVVPAT